MAAAITPSIGLSPAARAALDFRAPYVAEKLYKERFVESLGKGEALFEEVKKYLVLCESDRSTSWSMYSLRVDQAWHQFILFTVQYADFCRKFFGRFLHHNPSNAPKGTEKRSGAESTFGMFCARYEALFGTPPPDVWYDHRGLSLQTRLVNEYLGQLSLAYDDDMIYLAGPSGNVAFGVNVLAGDAVEFVSRVGAFHIRELPGTLTDEERVAFASALVECRIVRVSA
jgi:hypothetical protein